MLEGVLFRAARVVVDVKLQTGQFNFEQAVQFMCEKTGFDSAFAVGEVKRYICEPTQPMSYLIGKLLILRNEEEFFKQSLKEHFL